MINLENLAISITDINLIQEIELTKQCRLNEIETKNITLYNKTINKKIKGFSANCHNYNRNKNVYSEAENQFKELLEQHNIKDYLHEFKVKVRDIRGKIRTYHIDFYFPSLKLAIEINPMFHYTFKTVVTRDKLRALLLKKNYHINTIDIKVHHKTVKGKTIMKLLK
jgi:very-short-patch-repair endonuclease